MKFGMITAATLSTLLTAGANAGLTVTGDAIEYFPATGRANQTPGQPTTRINHIFGLGGAAGYRWDAGYSLELDYQVAGKTKIDNGYSWASHTTTTLNGTYELQQMGKFQPYVLGGYGRERLQAWRSGNTFSNNLLNLGVGTYYPLADKLFLRAEFRGSHAMGSGTKYNDFVALVGLQYRFDELSMGLPAGEAKPAVEYVEPVPAKPAPVVAPTPVTPVAPVVRPPADKDKDGVPDGQDQCPNTPYGVSVTATGCAVDSDGDGVADISDKCPGTSAGSKVDASGCSQDADMDGVSDSMDKCPNTTAGAKVDANGCAVVVTEAIKQQVNILFDSGKQDIKSEFKGEIKKVADLAQQYPTSMIEIQGYTDNKGNLKANTALSQRRAAAVRDSLIKDFGIDATRVSAKGYGPANPVADNNTEDGRTKNRRVIAVLTGEQSKVVMKPVQAKPAKAKAKSKKRKSKSVKK